MSKRRKRTRSKSAKAKVCFYRVRIAVLASAIIQIENQLECRNRMTERFASSSVWGVGHGGRDDEAVDPEDKVKGYQDGNGCPEGECKRYLFVEEDVPRLANCARLVVGGHR